MTKSMDDVLRWHFEVDGDDFESAGEISSKVKGLLKKLGVDPEIIRRVAISMYEGEINMVIHAYGGVIDVELSADKIYFVLKDKGPGIPDIEKAMQEGYSTASDNVRELGFGAGMGLSNMKKYSDKMVINTEIGVGTTVEIEINMK